MSGIFLLSEKTKNSVLKNIARFWWILACWYQLDGSQNNFRNLHDIIIIRKFWRSRTNGKNHMKYDYRQISFCFNVEGNNDMISLWMFLCLTGSPKWGPRLESGVQRCDLQGALSGGRAHGDLLHHERHCQGGVERKGNKIIHGSTCFFARVVLNYIVMKHLFTRTMNLQDTLFKGKLYKNSCKNAHYVILWFQLCNMYCWILIINHLHSIIKLTLQASRPIY